MTTNQTLSDAIDTLADLIVHDVPTDRNGHWPEWEPRDGVRFTLMWLASHGYALSGDYG
jgi:hypothetical protein